MGKKKTTTIAMEEINPKDWHELKGKVDEVHTALLGDKFGNKGYMQRLEDVETHVEDSKKRVWTERGILLALSAIWVLIVKFWDKIFGQ
jgi:hypothetical protein